MRHGRSGADDENVHGGRYDDALTDAGRHRAVAQGGIARPGRRTGNLSLALARGSTGAPG
jgi:broad specificity phosphatase PhoE